MPKPGTNNATAGKTKTTARNPLREVSGKAYSKSTARKLSVKYEDGAKDNELQPPQVGNDASALDRLLLLHTDLSSLVHQIDDLVVEALKLTSKNGMKEVESFAKFLSQMQTSLKPWVPRFQKVLSDEPVNQMEQAVVGREDESVMKDINCAAVESPDQSKWDSLVSSSPLVSWKASNESEGGRQLFLLTPLPRPKALSVNYQELSKSVPGVRASISLAPQPANLDEVEETNNGDCLEGVAVKQTPKKVSDRPLESKCVSPHSVFGKDGCMLVMTPCLKFSPPKSCVLLEPLSAFAQKKSLGARWSTPFVKEIQNSDESPDAESSTFWSSHKMPLEYPDFLGIKLGNNNGNRKKAVEESPNWLMSPPKTCVLMEPPDENLQIKAPCEQQPLSNAGFNLRHGTTNLFSRNTNDPQELCSSFNMVESTPMPREPESTIPRGKRPGENTLKKELWTRFEAASISEAHFNFPTTGIISQKGFLDRLDEVS